MKAFKKLSLAFVALCLAFTAVSCNNDDNDDGAAVVYTWTGTSSGAANVSFKLTAYDDNSFVVTMSTAEGSSTASKGTYKINSDGTTEITETAYASLEDGSLTNVENPTAVKVTDIKKFDITSNCGLTITFTLDA